MLVPLLLDLSGVSTGVPVVLPPGCTWSFPSYAAFRTTIQQLIDGDDISQSSLSVQILDLIISTGEKRVYRDVRSSCQDVALALTVGSNSAALPADLLELRSVYVSGAFPATYIPYEAFQGLLQKSGLNSRKAIRFSFEGDHLVFWPAQADGTVVTGRYYKYFCSIVTEGLAGNLFFARYPDLWLYAALVECAPYVGELARLPEWKERYGQLVADAQAFERRRFSRGSKLATRIA